MHYLGANRNVSNLVIDLFDGTSKKLLWRGMAYFSISEGDYLTRASTFYQVISGARVSSPILDFIQANGATYPTKAGSFL
jgi:hypothetical protein